MRCGVCLHPLVKVGFRIKEYRRVDGGVYKRIAWPRYASCPRLNDPRFHPKHKPIGATR
jgi:hypothetical protein